MPVREVAGADIYQAVAGSSANPGLRDFGIVAKIVEGKQTHPRVSFDVNPTSRQTLEALVSIGLLAPLVRSGARLHQSGCMGCIGMGQAPATGQISLRTMPRNFPGRSGVQDDLVYLCSPETAAASALTGKITDPRDLEDIYGMTYPVFELPSEQKINKEMLAAPPESGDGVDLIKGPNISSLPDLEPLPDDMEVEVLLKVGDGISTDEIMPAGQRVLPYRSNIPKISEFTYIQIDDSYPERARAAKGGGTPLSEGVITVKDRVASRGHRPSMSVAARGHRQELRAHPLAESRQFRDPPPRIHGQLGLRIHRARRRAGVRRSEVGATGRRR